MGQYSKKAQEKIAEVMREYKKGKLKSSSGEKVTKSDQVIAIAISEADSEGLKVPNQKKKASQKKDQTVSYCYKQSLLGISDCFDVAKFYWFAIFICMDMSTSYLSASYFGK